MTHHGFDSESMAAYYAEQEMLAALEPWHHDQPPITREAIWITKDGEHVAIKDMKDSHLLNTIRVLQGRSPHGTVFKCDPVDRRELLNAMCNEAYRRGLQLL